MRAGDTLFLPSGAPLGGITAIVGGSVTASFPQGEFTFERRYTRSGGVIIPPTMADSIGLGQFVFLSTQKPVDQGK
jgi:hypothetical protein